MKGIEGGEGAGVKKIKDERREEKPTGKGGGG